MNTITNIAESGVEKTMNAVEQTRDAANDKVDDVQNKLGELKSDIKPALQNAADLAKELASSGKELAMKANSKLQEQLGQCVDTTGRYVADQPIKAMLMAAAAGGILTALLTSKRNRNTNFR